MSSAFIVGTGMTKFGLHPDRGLRSLAEEAVNQALLDAKMAPKDVEMAFFANAAGGLLTGQEMIRGQVALRHTGLLGVPMVNVDNACCGGSSAFHLAHLAVASGHVDVALAVGSEKLSHPDKVRSITAIRTGTDLDALDPEDRVQIQRTVLGPDFVPDLHDPVGQIRPFMDTYADWAKDYMECSGATAEDFARVTVKNNAHGKLNPSAHYGREVSVEDVLTARHVAGPLTVLMCCPISDGAAAVVVCSDKALRRFDVEPVRVLSTVLVGGRDRTPGDATATERAARRAYDLAGVGPQDLDVVELHDAAAPSELKIYEELDLCGPGEGPKLAASGATSLGGRIPVNPSGGLLARGHPLGATGCAQLVELSDQLRGRGGPRQVLGARIALAENGGGFIGTDPAAMVVTILSRARRTG